ncbi:hypothetical protein QZH41_014658, partial [Actinostola sp. cb2023]
MDNFNKVSLEDLFAEIAEEFGCCWKEVGRHLLRKECSIENIDADYSKVSEKSYQMLHKWKNESGCRASIKDIFKCLNSIGKETVAEKLLEYLPDTIARECEVILLSSSKKIRCAAMTTRIHNIPEQHKDLTVEKQLRLQDDEEVYLCSSNITKKKYLLKEIEERPKVYRWAARMVIPEKQLTSKKKTLRKTNEFLKDLELKEDTVKRLKSIIEKLQDKLHIKHMNFCQEHLKCTNCEKTALMRELLEKDLSLLHHELVNMIRGSRRLSVSGIPTERMYDLAERAYSICEEHKRFHDVMVKLPRRCSMELLDDIGPETEPDELDDPLQCTLNILRHFGRKRKVVQSLTPKQRKSQTKKVQRHSSDKPKSRFYIPSRQCHLDTQEDQETIPRSSWPTRIGSKFFVQRKRSSEKKQRRKSDEMQKNELDKERKLKASQVSVQKQHDNEMYHPRSNTFPSSLADINGNNARFYGSQELDDINDTGSVFSCIKDLRISEVSSHDPGTMRLCDTVTRKLHMSSSDSNLLKNANRRKGVVTRDAFSPNNGLCDSRSPGVFEILTQKHFLDVRQRSFSDDEVMQGNKRYQVFQYRDPCVQQSSPELTTIEDVQWKT